MEQNKDILTSKAKLGAQANQKFFAIPDLYKYSSVLL